MQKRTVQGILAIAAAWFGTACSSSDSPGAEPTDTAVVDTTAGDTIDGTVADTPSDGVTDTGGRDGTVSDSGSKFDAVGETAVDAAVDTGTVVDTTPFDATVDCASPLLYPESVVGSPPWKVAQVAVYAAPIGDFTGDLASPTYPFNASVLGVVSPNHTLDGAKRLFKAAKAHAPPYDNELLDGLSKTSFTNSGCFNLSDLSAPSGLVILMMLVPGPGAVVGKSFEEPAGGLLSVVGGLSVNGDLFVDDVLTDSLFDSTLPKAVYAYDYPTSITIDGWGHVLLAFGENQVITEHPLKPGNYRFEVRLSSDSGTYKTTDRIGFVVK